jgi:hypothetical protein
VAIGDGAFAVTRGAERRVDMIGHFARGIECRACAAGTVDGNCCLKKMTCTIHFVQIEVGPAVVAAFFGEITIEVAIRTLGSNDIGDDFIADDTQARRITDCIVPADGLEPFVDVRIIEKQPDEVARFGPCCTTEIGYALGFFTMGIL